MSVGPCRWSWRSAGAAATIARGGGVSRKPLASPRMITPSTISATDRAAEPVGGPARLPTDRRGQPQAVARGQAEKEADSRQLDGQQPAVVGLEQRRGPRELHRRDRRPAQDQQSDERHRQRREAMQRGSEFAARSRRAFDEPRQRAQPEHEGAGMHRDGRGGQPARRGRRRVAEQREGGRREAPRDNREPGPDRGAAAQRRHGGDPGQQRRRRPRRRRGSPTPRPRGTGRRARRRERRARRDRATPPRPAPPAPPHTPTRARSRAPSAMAPGPAARGGGTQRRRRRARGTASGSLGRPLRPRPCARPAWRRPRSARRPRRHGCRRPDGRRRTPRAS